MLPLRKEVNHAQQKYGRTHAGHQSPRWPAHYEAEALARLEEHYKDQLLIVAGEIHAVGQQAQELRLAISTHEAGLVLDYIEKHQLAGISIETAEEVINALFPDRFIEP